MRAVGQSHCHHLWRLGCKRQPRSFRCATPFRPPNNRHGTGDHHPPDITLTRDSAEPHLAAGTVLSRRQTQPGRKVAARVLPVQRLPRQSRLRVCSASSPRPPSQAPFLCRSSRSGCCSSGPMHKAGESSNASSSFLTLVAPCGATMPDSATAQSVNRPLPPGCAHATRATVAPRSSRRRSASSGSLGDRPASFF